MDAAILKQLDKNSNSTDSWLKDGEIFLFLLVLPVSSSGMTGTSASCWEKQYSVRTLHVSTDVACNVRTKEEQSSWCDLKRNSLSN